MTGSPEFLPLDDLVALLSGEIGMGRGEAQDAIMERVRADAVKLLLPGGSVMLYSEWKRLAAAQRPQQSRPAQRYNPNQYAAHRRERPAPSPVPRQSPSMLPAGCALHVGDLRKTLRWKLGRDDLVLGVAPAVAVAPAAEQPPAAAVSAESSEPLDLQDDAAPAARVVWLMQFFREHGRKPDFDAITKFEWCVRAARLGYQFSKDEADFEAAWRVAQQKNWITRRRGPPERDHQSARIAEAIGSEKRDEAEAIAITAGARRAGGA